MKRRFLLRFCAGIAALLCLAAPAAAEETDDAPQIDAPYAIVFNASDDGEILYGKQQDQPVYCGFLPRVMTCLLIAENVPDLDQTVTMTKEMLANTPKQSAAKLSAGETVSYKDLIVAIATVNSQEAAVAAAMTIDETLPAFIERMNARAQALGAKNTVFTNVTGSYTENTRQITTLADTAKILTETLKHEVIFEATRGRTAQITVDGKQRVLYTRNMLIEPSSDYYNAKAQGLFIYSEGTSAIATSLTDRGRRIVSVAVTDQGYASMYADAAKLLDYSGTRFTARTLLEKGAVLKEIKVRYGENKDFAVVVAAEAVNAYLPKIYLDQAPELIFDVPEQLTAPVEKNLVVGTVTVRCGGKEYGKVEVKTQGEVPLDNFALYSDKVKSFFASPYLWLVLGIICTLVGGYILLACHVNKPRRKRSKAKDTGGRIRVDIPEDDD